MGVMYPAAMRIKKVDLMIDSNTNDCYLVVKGLIEEVNCCSLMVMAFPEVLKPCAFILEFLHTLRDRLSSIFMFSCIRVPG